MSAPPPPSVTDVGEDYISLAWGADLVVTSSMECHFFSPLAPGGWSTCKIYPVPNGANTITLTDLEMQSPYEVRLAFINANGERVVGVSLCVDTAPAGCGKRKKPSKVGGSHNGAAGCIVA